jgi:hypothetical protein
MVLDKGGVARELDVIDDLTSGAYEIPDLDVDDLRAARRLAAKYQELKIGMTDAVNAVAGSHRRASVLQRVRRVTVARHHCVGGPAGSRRCRRSRTRDWEPNRGRLSPQSGWRIAGDPIVCTSIHYHRKRVWN